MLNSSSTKWMSLLSIIFITFSLLARPAQANSKISLAIPAFAKECLYHDLTDDDHTLIINYQVLYGGDFELDFEITAPSGESIVKQTNEKYADFLLKTFGLGEYSFCFVNPYNQLKKVEFTIKLDLKEEEESQQSKIDRETVVSEHALSEIDRNLGKIDRIMNYLRAREWRNMSTVMSTGERSVYLSWLIIGIMVGLGAAQAFAVQMLFSDRNKTFV
ncbi:hypothetical protein WICPIJ_006709 [Wickerhamomyces pijperi]|uniref:GOLD domain-containing protein n=1 Tax=Wickerhamomyces pijperi TaxID=599730 RepID=A0A9P8Q179_WICPI|nr:hypothetical protein WICPIJ_006709 [Wickerhamomyces pijperi]